MAKVKTQDTERAEEIAAQVSSSEKFYNEHKGLIWGVLGGIVVVGLAILGYSKFIYSPAVAEAQQAVFPAELNFQNGEFELALNGDGNTLGFADIIDQYGSKAGKAVYLYAPSSETGRRLSFILRNTTARTRSSQHAQSPFRETARLLSVMPSKQLPSTRRQPQRLTTSSLPHIW